MNRWLFERSVKHLLSPSRCEWPFGRKWRRNPQRMQTPAVFSQFAAVCLVPAALWLWQAQRDTSKRTARFSQGATSLTPSSGRDWYFFYFCSRNTQCHGLSWSLAFGHSRYPLQLNYNLTVFLKNIHIFQDTTVWLLLFICTSHVSTYYHIYIIFYLFQFPF